MIGFCMKCKAEREIADPKVEYMKNGRPATRGKCPVCGTQIYRLGAEHDGQERSER